MKRGQAEKFKDAEDKLTSNRQDLGLTATDEKAGIDDRWARLHDGRPGQSRMFSHHVVAHRQGED